MKTLQGISLAVSVVLLAGCAGQQKTDSKMAGADAAEKPTVIFNVISGQDNPHEVTMALQLAGHALDDGRQVVLFFNVKGVTIPLKDLPPSLAYRTTPIKQLLADLIERGAIVLVCPHCMQAETIDANALIDSAQVANRERLFSRISADTVVFTY